MADELILDEMKKVVSEATSKGTVIRGLGAAAIRNHSPTFAARCPAVARPLTDLDFVTYAKQEKPVMCVLREFGYEQDRARAYIRAVSGRAILENPQNHLVVDLFFDKLAYNHLIELSGRLEKDPLAIPLADLLLEKTQIVQINEKDVKDLILLLREHALGSDDDDKVNVNRACEVLSSDWGFYYTVTTNLAKVADYARKLEWLGSDDRKDVLTKIETLKSAIEASPKSVGWKMRSKIGVNRKWYTDVEELTAGH